MPIVKTYDVPKYDDYSYDSFTAPQKLIDASRYRHFIHHINDKKKSVQKKSLKKI